MWRLRRADGWWPDILRSLWSKDMDGCAAQDGSGADPELALAGNARRSFGIRLRVSRAGGGDRMDRVPPRYAADGVHHYHGPAGDGAASVATGLATAAAARSDSHANRTANCNRAASCRGRSGDETGIAGTRSSAATNECTTAPGDKPRDWHSQQRYSRSALAPVYASAAQYQRRFTAHAAWLRVTQPAYYAYHAAASTTGGDSIRAGHLPRAGIRRHHVVRAD